MYITSIGGGSGQPPVIIGLTKLLHDLDININSVVGTWDSGGSSGELRDLYGVMPPGDILKNIMAFVPPDNRIIADTMLRRYDASYPKLYNHNSGNILLSALEQQSGSIIAAIRTIEKTLGTLGHVYPLTDNKTTLHAEMTRIKSLIVDGETEISDKIKSGYKITKLYVNPVDKIPALEILEKTDVLIISPGSLFTSIMPHFSIEKIRSACKKIKTKIIVANLIERGLNTKEYLECMKMWTDIEPTHIIFNSMINLPDKYKKEGYNQILIDGDSCIKGIKCISRPTMRNSKALLRHDPKRTGAAITEILSEEHLI